MPKEDITDLTKFLQPYPVKKQELALWLREFIWDMYPQANELIYDNYNALALGWSVTDRLGHTFCSIALYRTGNQNMHFGFYWGNEIADPDKMLLGNGSQYRYIQVLSKKEFPKAYIKKLVKEAWANSLAKVKDEKQIKQGLTIIKSVSAPKRK